MKENMFSTLTCTPFLVKQNDTFQFINNLTLIMFKIINLCKIIGNFKHY